ncbi:MAG: fibronectin type III domain-containing protein [Deltaproteobacteria bacterium]|nr:fibronectin type III domain-containing protein [Deltaproteobacteria bacterium]
MGRWLREKFNKIATTALVSFGFLFLLTACPKDVSLPSASETSEKSPLYSGFAGATAATTVGPTKVKITWTPASDSKVVAYNIYDSTLFFAPKLLKTATGNTTEVTLSGLETQTLYKFRVRAADKDMLEDGNTKDLSAVPYAGVLPAQVQSSTSAIIPFSDASNSDAVQILCSTQTNPVEELLLEITNVIGTTQATLNGLNAGATYTCRAATKFGSFVDNNSIKTTFTPMGTAATLVFATQPGSAAAGANLSTQPSIRVLDSNGTLVSAGPDSRAVITLTVSNSSPTVGTIRGTAAVQAVGGVATFSGLNLQEAGAKIFTATKEDTASQAQGSAAITQDSNQFTITPGSVSATNSTIAISPAVPPASPLIANGIESYSVVITLKDQYGNSVAGTRPVFASNISGDTLTQPALNTNVTGATTGSISTTVADSGPPYRSLNITSPAGLTGVAVAAPFSAGTPSKLAFSTQPTNSPAGANGMGVIRVAVQDANGNVITTGANATAPISMAISNNVNGAILTGTSPVNAVNGVAVFTGLGISKTGTGYKLLASSGSFTAAYSNSFNITAGTPNRITIAGPVSVISGACSTAITFQLQDLGNNPANAVQNTSISISGLGSGQLFTSSTCSGAAISATQTFTAGTNTKTYYLKDVKGEGLVVTASDPSMVLTSGTLPLNVLPNKIALLAESSPGVPLSVVSGRCSSAIYVTPAGENGAAAPLFAPTTVALTGVAGTQANVYSDAACTNLLSPGAIALPATNGGSFPIPLYLKDNRAESLSLTVTDPNGVMTTTSGLQPVSVTASAIGFTGPVSVVSGQCSSAYTVSLRDAQSNLVVAPANRALTIRGLESSAAGMFYTSASCTTGGSKTAMTIPQGNSSLQIYFKNTAAENLSIYLQDSLSQMNDSPTINIAISPSTLTITPPVAGNSKTTVCAGPFTVNTRDGANNVTAALSPITIALSGAGVGGNFFTSNACSTAVTQLTFAIGQGTKTFYFKGQYPQAALTFTATDNGSVLTSGSASWAVTAAPGFIGTAAAIEDSNGSLFWFSQGEVPVSARQDAARSVSALHFDSTYTHLYVVDSTSHRVLKYDYVQRKYIGWIGGFWSGAGIGLSGSTLTTPSSAACVSITQNQRQLPGWCRGGLSTANGNTTLGNFHWPRGIASDSTYIYVSNDGSGSVNRYNAQTGAFEGWIGRITTTPTGSGTGSAGGCTSASPGTNTPGWCIGGNVQQINGVGDGSMIYPKQLVASGGYLYIGDYGKVLRYNAGDGSFAGWIGMVGGSSPTGGAAGCTSTLTSQITPGWCLGGTSTLGNPRTQPGSISDPRGIHVLGSILYVVDPSNGGVVSRFDTDTGAFIGLMTGLAYNWISPRMVTSDGSQLFIADWTRLIQVDMSGLVTGWAGKVSNNNSMSGTGCTSLQPNDNTPGFCLGGSSKAGMDERAFHNLTAIAYDGNGNILTGQGDNFPAIKIFNAATGVYGGSLGARSVSPSEWSNDPDLFAQYHGFDDKSMYTPVGSYVHDGHAYVVELHAARIKKIELATGNLKGWLGGITTVPTGGDAGCTSANAMGPSPGWCLGALFNPEYMWNSMIPQNTAGIMYQPMGITGDGTHLYVADKGLDRIHKFVIATGAYVGWVGRAGGTAPTAGAVGCIGLANGSATPGWCVGGSSQVGSDNGHLYNPLDVLHAGGQIYVLDSSNHRISRYNATTGAFTGWIGRTNTAPSSGCTVGSNGSYNVSVSGWCMGGTSQESSHNDRGGGFAFWSDGRGGLTSDGTFLYISNFRNIRVDKYSLAGVWQGAFSTRQDIYTRSFSSDPDTVAAWGNTGCSWPIGVVVGSDGFFYGMNYNSCNANGNASLLWKVTGATGIMYGWKGAIQSGNSPSGGEAGCSGSTNVTPAWCQGGRGEAGYRLGQFSQNAYHLSQDANFLYVSDENSHRLTRIPK